MGFGQVNDCSGKMGGAVAEAALGAGLQLVPVCLTGPGLGRNFSIQGIDMKAVDSRDRERVMDEVLQQYPNVIVVDYTLPAAVNGGSPSNFFFFLFPWASDSHIT
jgi:4-hydroxy-tetrahydrodipicolinate reductase